MICLYTIDVRKFDVDNFLSEALNNASLFRKKKYESYKVVSAKKQSIAVTYLLDSYLKTKGLSERDMEYETLKYGKPYFKNHSEIHFSLAHSKNYAMAAFSDINVGCDIELSSKIDSKIYNMVLSDEEKKIVMSYKDKDREYDEFFRYWVKKEAIIKLTGFGLNDNLKEVKKDGVFIGDMELLDINEKYHFAVCDDTNEIPKVNIIML